MNKMISVLIVDDEGPARKLVSEYLSGMDNIRIVAECTNGFEAIKVIQEDPPDLIFLDIQMPKITGFELLEVIEPGPEIIFTTAYDEYALKAFEMNAVDYLLKPFSEERFNKALDKAIERVNMKEGVSDSGTSLLREKLKQSEERITRIVVRNGAKLIVIPVNKVFYFTADGDYVKIISEEGSLLKESTMKSLEDKLPGDQFLRVHRSHIVNIDHVARLEPYSKDSHLAIMKNGDKVNISQEGYKKIRKMMT